MVSKILCVALFGLLAICAEAQTTYPAFYYVNVQARPDCPNGVSLSSISSAPCVGEGTSRAAAFQALSASMLNDFCNYEISGGCYGANYVGGGDIWDAYAQGPNGLLTFALMSSGSMVYVVGGPACNAGDTGPDANGNCSHGPAAPPCPSAGTAPPNTPILGSQCPPSGPYCTPFYPGQPSGGSGSCQVSYSGCAAFGGTAYAIGASYTGQSCTQPSPQAPASGPPQSCPPGSTLDSAGGAPACVPNAGSTGSASTTTTTTSTSTPAGGGASTTTSTTVTNTCTADGACVTVTGTSSSSGASGSSTGTTTATPGTSGSGGGGTGGTGTQACGGSGDECNVKVDETGTTTAADAATQIQNAGNSLVGSGQAMDQVAQSVHGVQQLPYPGDGGQGGSVPSVTEVIPQSSSCGLTIEWFPGSVGDPCSVADAVNAVFGWFWGALGVFYLWRRGHDALQGGFAT